LENISKRDSFLRISMGHCDAWEGKEKMTLKILISGQKLHAGNHTPGCPNRGLDGVRIKKTMLEGKNKGKPVRIDVRSGDLTFAPGFTKEGKTYIRKEIVQVLNRDKQKLKELAKSFSEILRPLGGGQS